MKRLFTVTLALAVLVLLAAPVGAQPSAKSAVGISEAELLGTEYGVWTTLNPLNSALHTSEQKDLIFDVSLECGLFTKTTVQSGGGKKAGSRAEAGVMVRVLLDPEFDPDTGEVAIDGDTGELKAKVAAPGDVTFCQRTQELDATFGGILDSCTDFDADGHIRLDECTLTDETLNLLLSTLTANAFNFTMTDLGAGDHNIVVQAKIDNKRCTLEVDEETGEETYVCLENSNAFAEEASGMIGKGSMAVDEVRFTKDIILQ